MSSILPLIFSLLLLASCGKHEQSSFGKEGVADTIRVENSDELSQDVMEENLQKLEAYAKKGGDLNKELKNGRTLLTEACFWLKFKVIEFLVNHKADIHAKDRAGKSPADYGEEDIKIKRTLFPELVKELKLSLMRQAKGNNMTELKKTLEENPPINFYLLTADLGDEVAAFEGETFLTFCVKNKLEGTLRLLAQPKYELDVNLPNKQGETALKIARELKFINIEKLLVKLGAKE